MKLVRFLSSVLLFSAATRAATLSASDQIVSPGGSVLVSLALASGGQNISGIQFDVAWDAALDVHVATGAQVGISTKSLYTSLPQTRVLRCLVVGLNRNSLADGELIRLFVDVGSGAAAGTSQLRLLNLSATDPSGTPILLTGGLISVQVQAGNTTQAIQASGIVNAASLLPGPICPGEIVTLFGSITTSSPVVLFNGVPAPILYAGPGQINAIVPFGLDLSNPAQVTIQQAISTTTLTVPVAAASPAIFAASASGAGTGTILNQDYSVNSPGKPASPGSVVMIYGTGFGALTPTPADGQIQTGLATTNSAVTATIGGIPAPVTYSGSAPGLIAGIMQINVRVPDGAGSDPAAPISLSVGPFTTPPGITLAVK